MFSILSAIFLDQEVPETYNYTVTVNEDNIINNVNLKTSKLTIKTNSPLDKDLTGVTLEVKDSDDKIVDKLKLDTANSNNTIKKSMTSQELPLKYNNNINGNLSSLFLADGTKDGNYTGLLKDSDEKIIAKFTFEVCLGDIPEAYSIKAERDGTPNGKLSLVGHGESPIVKVYYTIAKLDASGEPDSDEPGNTSVNSGKIKFSDMKVLNVTNNKLDSALLDRTLVNDEAYRVYFIVENAKGNRSKWNSVSNVNTINPATSLYATTIVKDTIELTDKLDSVQSVTAPDLSSAATAEFSWTEVSSVSSNGTGDYVVSLYKDGEIVSEYIIPYDGGSTVKKDFAADIKANGGGTYTVKVVAQSKKGDKQDSDPVSSTPVTVTKLQAVTGLTFTPNTASIQQESFLGILYIREKENLK